jgi:hypothetical protein
VAPRSDWHRGGERARSDLTESHSGRSDPPECFAHHVTVELREAADRLGQARYGKRSRGRFPAGLGRPAEDAPFGIGAFAAPRRTILDIAGRWKIYKKCLDSIFVIFSSRRASPSPRALQALPPPLCRIPIFLCFTLNLPLARRPSPSESGPFPEARKPVVEFRRLEGQRLSL